MNNNNSSISLDDKYTKSSGKVFISGTQALVRLPLIQKQKDEQAGLNTAGFITGYRGSPIGGYDAVLFKEKDRLEQAKIHFEAGMNEDMAATAVWGSQQLHTDPNAQYDGVFSIWYGKGPGVDRSGDPIKHANLSGTAPKGGVLAIFGDDHPGKSSSVAHQSEQAMATFHVPVLYPATLQDYIEYGLHGWAMSRYSGCWIGFKCVNETIENTASINVDPDNVEIVIPDEITVPEGGVHFKPQLAPGIGPQQEEILTKRTKLPMAQAYARANKLDKEVVSSSKSGLGIVTAGKSYLDVMQALQLLGIDENRASQLGLSIYKVALIWPLEPQNIKAFAVKQKELLFVEEKGAFMEDQTAKLLYNLSPEQRPTITGKKDPQDNELLPSDVQLDPLQVAQVIVNRLQALSLADDALLAAKQQVETRLDVCPAPKSPLARIPYFCSGCPHNRSTKVPEGSKAMSGIGCHAMASYINGQTTRPAHMGGEGGNWIGMAPFTSTQHMFQNLGDGTYSHSGLMALRASVLSKTNITYKILFNDAVAMTGGQPVEGQLTVAEITHQVASQGVRKIAIITDEPDKYPAAVNFAQGTNIHHRLELDAIQREFREISGVTVIINDQTCAAEKRRRRKKGTFPDPSRRAFINHLVCEGCGDCSVKANCVSLQPKETQFGRKRQIDQSSCNKDFSCIEGFCPSFVTIEGGELRKTTGSNAVNDTLFSDIPVPSTPTITASYGIMIAGIGGTGVVTIGAVLGMAAHIEDKGVSIFDMTGLAQKGGAVYSHLRIANSAADLHAPRLGKGDADLLIGCDIVAAGASDALLSLRKNHSQAILNTDLVPTAVFQLNTDIPFENQAFIDTFQDYLDTEQTHLADATNIAKSLMGNTIGANMFMVGFALQKGLLPVQLQSIQQAIKLNGVAIDFNLQALELGRLFAHTPEKVAALMSTNEKNADQTSQTLSEFIDERAAFLTDYQNKAYAQQYLDFIEQIRAAEHKLGQQDKQGKLTKTVARYLFKLMSYKDEYEVARLYTSGEFERQIKAQFTGKFSLNFHLAPPLLAKKDKVTGAPQKRAYGPWVFTTFKLLKKLKGLRGTPLDIFGYTEERRMERRLIEEYQALLLELLPKLTSDNLAIAIEIASLPEQLRGFGHVKARHLQQVQAKQTQLVDYFYHGKPEDLAVEVKMVS